MTTSPYPPAKDPEKIPSQPVYEDPDDQIDDPDDDELPEDEPEDDDAPDSEPLRTREDD